MVGPINSGGYGSYGIGPQNDDSRWEEIKNWLMHSLSPPQFWINEKVSKGHDGFSADINKNVCKYLDRISEVLHTVLGDVQHFSQHHHEEIKAIKKLIEDLRTEVANGLNEDNWTKVSQKFTELKEAVKKAWDEYPDPY